NRRPLRQRSERPPAVDVVAHDRAELAPVAGRDRAPAQGVSAGRWRPDVAVSAPNPGAVRAARSDCCPAYDGAMLRRMGNVGDRASKPQRIAFETARLRLARYQLAGDHSRSQAAAHATQVSAEALAVERVGVWL